MHNCYALVFHFDPDDCVTLTRKSKILDSCDGYPSGILVLFYLLYFYLQEVNGKNEIVAEQRGGLSHSNDIERDTEIDASNIIADNLQLYLYISLVLMPFVLPVKSIFTGEHKAVREGVHVSFNWCHLHAAEICH